MSEQIDFITLSQQNSDPSHQTPSEAASAFSASNFTLEDVKAWGNAFLEKGYLKDTKWRRASTSLEQLTSILGPEEPRDVQSLLDNMATIAQRWIRKGNNNTTTGETYRYRACRILEEFILYKRDGKMPSPGGERSSKAAKTSSMSNGTSNGKKSKNKVVKEEPEVVEEAPLGKETGALRSFPLTRGGEMRFTFPEEGVTSQDVHRFFCHLMTLAVDFDPRSLFPGLPMATEPSSRATEKVDLD